MVFEIGQWTVVENANDIQEAGVREAPKAPEGWEVINDANELRNAQAEPGQRRNVNPQVPDRPAQDARAAARREQVMLNNRQAEVVKMARTYANKQMWNNRDGYLNETMKKCFAASCESLMNLDSVKQQLGELTSLTAVEAKIQELINHEAESLAAFAREVQEAKAKLAVKPLADRANDDVMDCLESYETALNREVDAELVRLLQEAPRDPESGRLSEQTLRQVKEGVEKAAGEFAAHRLAAMDVVAKSDLPEKTKAVLLKGVFDAEGGADALQEAAKALVARFKTLSEPAGQALLQFAKTLAEREELSSVVSEAFAPVSDAVITEMELLPERGITCLQAAEVLAKVDFERNVRETSAFARTIGDEDVRTALGLSQRIREGKALSTEDAAEITKKSVKLLAGAKKLREAMNAFKHEKAGAPLNFCYQLDRAVKEQIQSGRVGDADIEEFKKEWAALYENRGDLAKGIEHVKKRHPEWEAKEKAGEGKLFADTLTYLAGVLPGERTPLFNSTAEDIEALVCGTHKGLQLPRENQGVFLKALSLAGFTPMQWNRVLEKLPELAAKEAAQGALSAQEVIDVLWGPQAAPLPENADLKTVQGHCQVLGENRIFHELARRWPEVDSLRRDYENRQPQDPAESELERTNNIYHDLADQYSLNHFSTLTYVLSAGLKPEVAVESFLGAKDYDLHSFVEPPTILLNTAESVESGEALFREDMKRHTNDMQRVGKSVVEVQLPDGRVESAHNGTKGAQDDADLERFMRAAPSTKTEGVLKAMRALCGGNESQYRLLLQTLTQGGVQSFGAFVRQGVLPELAFHVKKDDAGNLVVTARNGDAKESVRLEAEVVIPPEGPARYTQLHVWDALQAVSGDWNVVNHMVAGVG